MKNEESSENNLFEILFGPADESQESNVCKVKKLKKTSKHKTANARKSLIDVDKFVRLYPNIEVSGTQCKVVDDIDIDNKDKRNLEKTVKYFNLLTDRKFNWNIFTEKKRTEIEKVFKMYPNFDEVAEIIKQQFVLMDISSSHHIKFENILIYSTPGCGKSSFVKKIVKILAPSSYVNIALGNGNASFELVGSEKEWSGSDAGKIIKSMMKIDNKGPIPNPIVILDELDKVAWGTSKAETSLNGVFSELLEKNNAKELTDLFMEVPVDASNINYIALANNIDEIPEHILSRFPVKIFIPNYTEEQMKNCVIPEVYKEFIDEKEIQKNCPSVLSPEMIDAVFQISKYDTRKIRAALSEVAKRSYEILEDGTKRAFFKVNESIEIKKYKTLEKQRIGFSM